MTSTTAPQRSLTVAVEPPVFARFPGLTIVAVSASNVDTTRANPAADALWDAAWQEVAASAAALGNAQSHPRVAPWRTAFREMGLAPRDFRSSIENLMRRALRGGEPFRISPLVDSYNALSIRHAIPIGCFDARAIHGFGAPLHVRETHAGDTFHALDANEPEPTAVGEVTWASGEVLITRHFVWRQSREALVTPDTRDVLIVAEVLGEVGHDAARALEHDLVQMLHEVFGVSSTSALINAEHPVADLPL